MSLSPKAVLGAWYLIFKCLISIAGKALQKWVCAGLYHLDNLLSYSAKEHHF